MKTQSYLLQYKRIILTLWSCVLAGFAYSQDNSLDITRYELALTPDIQNKSIAGTLTILFEVSPDTKTIALAAGNLIIDDVSGVDSYKKVDSKLVVELGRQENLQRQITIQYHGSPKKGLHFNTDLNQAHTVYFTDQWMVCNNSPKDRATFSLTLTLPKGVQSVASGELSRVEVAQEHVTHRWDQEYETPPYTYGFVLGSFNMASQQHGPVALNYFSSELSEGDLKKVFAETPAILEFFEMRSGVPYVQDSYSQVLIGENYQEMSGLSVLSSSYPNFVFKDSSEIHLTSHELAHQWWGNMITCEDFGHFWLNEAFAVYMASAFSEHRFGKEKYAADISIYKGIYDNLVQSGKDRPLVFKEWNPTRENRNVVYYKGAYVLHLLREKLGTEAFWKGIRYYSQNYYGKSVNTEDFKLAMENATNSDLDNFFKKWVYNHD